MVTEDPQTPAVAPACCSLCHCSSPPSTPTSSLISLTWESDCEAPRLLPCNHFPPSTVSMPRQGFKDGLLQAGSGPCTCTAKAGLPTPGYQQVLLGLRAAAPPPCWSSSPAKACRHRLFSRLPGLPQSDSAPSSGLSQLLVITFILKTIAIQDDCLITVLTVTTGSTYGRPLDAKRSALPGNQAYSCCSIPNKQLSKAHTPLSRRGCFKSDSSYGFKPRFVCFQNQGHLCSNNANILGPRRCHLN